MAHRRRPAMARSLALLLLLSCASSSPDLTSPPTGNPPPQEPPTQPPTRRLHRSRRLPRPGRRPAPPPGPPIPNPPGLGAGARILFIGNSLTEVNDVPGLVRSLASAAGLGWHIEAQLLGGASLQDHWERGAARSEFRAGTGTPSYSSRGPPRCPRAGATSGSGRRRSTHWSGRQAGGRRSIWCGRSERASSSSTGCAIPTRSPRATSGGYFLPAGETWRAAWRVQSSAGALRRRRVPPDDGGQLRGGAHHLLGSLGAPAGRPGTRGRQPADGGTASGRRRRWRWTSTGTTPR